MKINIELTDRQAYRMVDAILENNFFFAGCGNFDLSRREMVLLLQAAFSDSRKEKLAELYDDLRL
jgi:hypothetical protein